jgi:hypothetical protein
MRVQSRVLTGLFAAAFTGVVAGRVAIGSAQQQRQEQQQQQEQQQEQPQQQSDLPEGDGKSILLTSCTASHDLTEVTKFRGYYTRDEWRDIVHTMIEYGARVQEKDVDVLVDYLARNFGKASEERR